jgi:hypothetical protein
MAEVFVTITMWEGSFVDADVHVSDPDPDNLYPGTCDDEWDNGLKIFVCAVQEGKVRNTNKAPLESYSAARGAAK